MESLATEVLSPFELVGTFRILTQGSVHNYKMAVAGIGKDLSSLESSTAHLIGPANGVFSVCMCMCICGGLI